jgi:hypothetical protein
MTILPPPIVEGERLTVLSNGGTWFIEWHPAGTEAEGTNHGANAFCVTCDNHVVLIRYRRLVPADDLLTHLWIEEGFEALYHRVLIESGMLAGNVSP